MRAHGHRARFLALSLAGVAAACGGSDAPSVAPVTRRPNVVIVVLDTLRPDRLGCYGAERPTSPRLDALAAESVVFDNAQSAAPLTVASLLSLMTSLYPEVHQVQGALNPGRMSDNVTTLAEVLSEHGYATAAFTEGGYANPHFGLGQGFDVYPARSGDDVPNVSNLLGESRLSANLDRTLAWLQERRDRPFFLFFHTYEVHQPNYARPEYVRHFRPAFDEAADHARAGQAIARWNRQRAASAEDCQLLLEHLYQCSLAGLPPLKDPDGFARAASAHGCGPLDAAQNRALIALARDLYDAAIRYMDDELARLWDALRELGLDDQTILVVCSDHGEGLGEHGELEHGNAMHEEALRVALMMRVPGVRGTPRRVPDLVRTVDVAPTLLELLGVDVARLPLQGQSLVPLLRGARADERVAFSHARSTRSGQDPQFTVTDGRWRLIEEPAAGRAWLFDRAADPGEIADVSTAHPDVVARLSAQLAQQAQQDRWLREKISTAPTAFELDAQTLRELEALGYAGHGSK